MFGRLHDQFYGLVEEILQAFKREEQTGVLEPGRAKRSGRSEERQSQDIHIEYDRYERATMTGT